MDRIISGALFDFLGYLSTQENFNVGRSHPLPDLIKHYEIWAKLRNLDITDPEITYWYHINILHKL